VFTESYAVRAARRNEALYDAYSTAIRLGGLPVDYTLPAGVTVPGFEAKPFACGCRSEECFFCGQELDAMEVACWEDEQTEWEMKYSRRFYED
jgi:hypothetical protein